MRLSASLLLGAGIGSLAIALPPRQDSLGPDCTFYSSDISFDAAFPGLVLEDFADANVVARTSGLCAAPVDSTGDGGTCFDPGDIEPGVTLDDAVPGTLVNLAGIGYGSALGNPLDGNSLAGAVTGSTRLTFRPSVRQVGLEIEHLDGGSGPGSATIEIHGLGGGLIDTTTIPIALTAATFVGVSCEEPIESVSVLGGARLPFVGSVRFGTSEPSFTRFCVAESVASANTGLKTEVILESQGPGGGLLPFDPSIAGNAAPKRFMMIAKDAPGPGNGGVANIGYFIMGTGANTFVPPGSAGPICVAPGIRRYIGPVNTTGETITFHDSGGAPTTLVGQGFSRVALGAGAHSVGGNIGGTLGFHWSFQAWHRDTPGLANLSDAVAVDFVP